MNISSSFQMYSVTAMRLSITERPSTTVTTQATASAPTTGVDTVTLSPEASSASGDAAPSTGVPVAGTAAPPTTATPPTRGEALLAALDADEDGSVTKEEFTEGALALLKRDAPRRANDDGRGQRGLRGLERRLEKAFARVDANRDGSVDASELTAALEGARRGRGDKDQDEVVTPESAGSGATPTTSLSVTYVSVTWVSVAVKRYTSLQPSTPPPVTQPPVTAGTTPVGTAAAGEIEDPAPSAPVAA